MAIKMKKRDLVIAFLIIAGILGGVLAGLASCTNVGLDGMDLSTPETGVDVGGSVPVPDTPAAPVVSPANGGVVLASDNDQFGIVPDISVPGTLKVSAGTVCDTYSWYLDGDLQTGEGKTEQTIELDTTTMEKGPHRVDFIGSISGSPYSKSLNFEVQ
jgi:hypothetical protein